MNIECLGICGGNGVILHPFKNNLIANHEIRPIFNTPDEIQWYLNFTSPKVNTTYFKKKVKPNVIVGAPDCGHSSVLSFSRAKKLSDPKENASLSFFIEAVNKLNPIFFLMENLPKLLENYGSSINEVFPEYKLLKYIEPVSAWGNSQVTRVRLVIIGIRKDHLNYKKYFRLPQEVTLKTEGQLIKMNGLIPSGHIREPDDYSLNLYYGDRRSMSVAEAKKIWMTEFANNRRWPVNAPRMKNQPGVSRNFANDYPLTVRKQNRQFNHRGEVLTPREMARIQGIPDDFKIWVDPNRLIYSLNKARATVTKSPPYEIGLWFYNCLNNIP